MKRAVTKLMLATCSALVLASGCSAGDGGRSAERALPLAHPGPQFPGAGTGSAGLALTVGSSTVTCDGRVPSPVAPFAPAPPLTRHQACFFAEEDEPAAFVEWIVESAPAEDQLVHVRLTLNPAFADNSYGANAIGWGQAAAPKPKPGDKPKPARGAAPVPAPTVAGGVAPAAPADKPKGGRGHTFRDLVGSDHAEFKLHDAVGKLVLQFKADYLSEAAGTRSGYATLGVRGGEGKLIAGRAEDVVQVSTSLERNLNACGLTDFLTDSPATDQNYTPNPLAPEWDYRVVYDVWVKAAAFGDAGFGKAVVDFVHASPSKLGSNTVEVHEGPCPPSWPECVNPDACLCDDEPSCFRDAGRPVGENPVLF